MIFLLCLCSFFVSDDLFSVVKIGGFTLRLFQVAMLPILAAGLWKSVSRSVWPTGFGYLLLWTLFILGFVPNTVFLSRSIGYGLFLIFNVLMVLGITAVVDTEAKLHTVLRFYVYSFGFSAAFGLLQFALPLAGFQPPLVIEWWFPGTLARINGFTYEPSYYATYMLTGWVMMDYLRLKKYSIPYLRTVFWLVTIALFMSSSRMGWVLMAAWLGLKLYWRVREGKSLWLPVTAACGVVLLAAVALRGVDLSTLDFLTNGLGILDDYGSHSTKGRWDLALQTLHIYTSSPVIGVSLGGVAPAIGGQNHVTIDDNEDAKANEGLCTTLEILAASGTFGFLFYLAYMSGLFYTIVQVPDDAVLNKALGWALVFLILILQFNQNILRPYVWFHIGLLSAAYRLLPRVSHAVRPVQVHA
ncbi:MAG TPA: O-antigen ligase family protein [Terriglobales bacterium]|nr:O-antigen ligase family protein [Terriglobales bacterium]